jgi:spore coat protein A
VKIRLLLYLFVSLLFCFISVSKLHAQLLPGITDPQGMYVNPIADPQQIPKWQNALPIVADLGLRIDGTKLNTNLTIHVKDTKWDMIGAGRGLQTTVWGVKVEGVTGPAAGIFTHPGATIVAKKNVPLTINWINDFAIGTNFPIPVDSSIMTAWNMEAPFFGHNISDLGIPFVAHLHGGHNLPQFDGLPMQWFSSSYHTNPGSPLTHGPECVGNVFTYPNDQEAGTLWYHDHSMGVTRLMAYMGLAGFYFIRDENEMNLINTNQIPTGAQEIELAIQDKMFYPDGSLAYPDVQSGHGPDPFAQIEPEMFGQVICVNGKVWPYLNVERKQYRFRIVNASDSRFYHFTLPTGTSVGNLNFTIIGTDDALLYQPVVKDGLLIGPGERYDVVVDFRNPALAGQSFIMLNDAGAPFGEASDPTNYDPNTVGQILKFIVSNSSTVNDPVVLPATLRPAITPLAKTGPTRQLILGETRDQFGRTMPILGTVAGGYMAFMDPITEKPIQGQTEIWEIYNTTVDAHPIHLHLINFQIINRQKYTFQQSETGVVSHIEFSNPPEAPEAYELGWKDTKIMYPGEVTRIIATFDRVGKYVWHCHILSHEEHDMMRYYEVVAATTGVAQNLSNIPLKFSLMQNYPNPFNPTTTIKFTLPENSFVTLKVYDILGRETATLINQVAPKGNHEVNFNASGLASGMYVYRLSAGSFTETKKMLLMK